MIPRKEKWLFSSVVLLKVLLIIISSICVLIWSWSPHGNLGVRTSPSLNESLLVQVHFLKDNTNLWHSSLNPFLHSRLIMPFEHSILINSFWSSWSNKLLRQPRDSADSSKIWVESRTIPEYIEPNDSFLAPDLLLLSMAQRIDKMNSWWAWNPILWWYLLPFAVSELQCTDKHSRRWAVWEVELDKFLRI